MEMSQENSLYSYVKQTKMSFFVLLLLSENRKQEQVFLVPVGGGRRWGKGV
jgi:hypothetical protein